jgi:uncharacterized membrane protein
MRFLSLSGFFALFLAVPILLLYFLRLRRREVTVPSLLLWEAVPVDRRANRPWQRLRHNWLLYLQLLVLLTLVLALARPAIPASLAPGGQIIVLLDVSASMQARLNASAAVSNSGETRFDAALQALRELVSAMNGQDSVSLVAVGAEPRLLLRHGDAAALRRTLDELFPTDGVADWQAAVGLAAGLSTGSVAEAANGDVTTLLVTDGAVDETLPTLPGHVHLIEVGDRTANVGITAFALRMPVSGDLDQGYTALVQLVNVGPATQRTLALYADGVLVERLAVDVPASPNGERVTLSLPHVPVVAWAEARLEGQDALAVDDYAWVALSGSGEGRVLLATAGNRFLHQALRTLPGLVLTRSTDALSASFPMERPEGERDARAIASDYDLVVADGIVTETLPATNLWLIAPQMASPCGEVGEIFTVTSPARGQWTHPLLTYVDWSDVHVARARYYTPAGDAEILLETAQGPLLWVVDHPSQRVACMAFDLHDSDLPLRLAFPILTANLTRWLLPQVSSEPLVPLPTGHFWESPLPQDAIAEPVITLQESVPGSPAFHHEFSDLENPGGRSAGLYRVDVETASGMVSRYVALSLLDEQESDLRPREIRIGGEVLAPFSDEAPAAYGWRDMRRWPVAIALLLLLVEALIWWMPSLQALRLALRASLKRPTSRSFLSSPRMALSRLLASIFQRSRPSFSRMAFVVPLPLILRLLLVLLLVLALFDFRWPRRTRDLDVVFLMDRSASTQHAWDDKAVISPVVFVEEALASMRPQDRAAFIVFGRDAWVERALVTMPQEQKAAVLPSIATIPRADATDIEDAIRLGLALLSEGRPGRLVLLTDGLETVGDARYVLQEVQHRGIEVQLVKITEGAPGPEVWVPDLHLPARVYIGDRVSAQVEVASTFAEGLPTLEAPATDAVGVQLTWTVGDQAGQQQVEVTGHAAFAFAFTARERGFSLVRACVEAAVDTFPQNNCVDGWVLVEGPPQILVVGEPDERVAMVRALGQAGLKTVAVMPEALPSVAQGLADYAGVVLVNTPARAFSPQALQALHDFVRDIGGALVAVGGPQSYGVGGWLGTPLEDALPVEMRVQDPRRFPPLAMVIVIDKSGSMTNAESGVPKIRLAAEAAARVAEALNDSDTLAVVAFDDRPADTLGPLLMTERESMIAALLRLQAGGGGIYVRESLEYAVSLLRDEQLPGDVQRHILLLADGADAEHQEGVLPLVEVMRDEGITVSVVAIGTGDDVPFLKQVAILGEGRFYLTQRAADLPAVFAEETARAKRSYIVEELFYPDPVSRWMPLDDIAATPPLQGYVAATPKTTAHVVWQATQGDPLLAVWQYGLGQAVAWTSDATGRWASAWVTWDDFARFWGSVVRAVLPPPSSEGVTLRTIQEGEHAQVQVDVISDTVDAGVSSPPSLRFGEGGAGVGERLTYVDGLTLAMQVARPGSTQDPEIVPLHQTAPGRYEGAFALGTGDAMAPADSLLLHLFGDRSLTAGWVAPPPAETIPGDVDAAIDRLVALADGTRVEDPAAAFAHTLRRRDAARALGRPLASLLLIIVVLLWPVDIAWRRLALSRADWLRLWGKVREWLRRRDAAHLPRRGPAPESPPTLASALRQQARRRREAQETMAARDLPGGETPSLFDEGISGSSTPSRSEMPAPEETSESSTQEEEASLASRLKRRLGNEE